MFRETITKKLSLYFTLTLVVFSLVIGSLFMLLFRNYSLEFNRKELSKKAQNIAETIPHYFDARKGGLQGFGMYLNVINQIEANNVWIVDTNFNLITGRSMHHQTQSFDYADLPENTDGLVQEVLENKIVFSEDFSTLLKMDTLSVGVPILDAQDRVLGAVLLHSPSLGVTSTITQGITILLLSTGLSLILAIILAVFLSKHFTKPLVKMNQAALKLVDNDYSATTQVSQKDEIGSLAKTLDTLAHRLGVAQEESKNLESMRRDFIANISHELRTPVTVMRGSLEALVDEVVTDPVLVSEYYQQMLSEAQFLERLVNDLVELSKLQSLDFKIIKSKISLSEVLDDVTRSAQKIADSKDIKIFVNKHASESEIKGDYGRIRQMIMIILDNAIKFSDPSSKVEIELNEKSLIIKDYGKGIASHELPYIFERFHKSRFEDNKQGTGLGLAIAKNIADRHGIMINVGSLEGEGSEFKFSWQ